MPWSSQPASSPTKSRNSTTVTLSVHDDTHIAAKSTYDAALNQIYRSIPNSAWDSEERAWLFPANHYDNLVRQLNAAAATVKEVPPFVLKVLREQKDEHEAINKMVSKLKEKLPEELVASLMRFQSYGVAQIISRNGRVLLGDEMGLGKTLQALATCAWWQAEIRKWLKVEEDSIQVIFTSKDLLRNDVQFIIISYDLASKDGIAAQLHAAKFKIVVADESHYLKSRDAKRTKMVLPLLKHATRALLLSVGLGLRVVECACLAWVGLWLGFALRLESGLGLRLEAGLGWRLEDLVGEEIQPSYPPGTPALSRPVELYTQITALTKAITSPSTHSAYATVTQHRYGWDYTGNSNIRELNWFLTKTVLIRRLKKDVLSELPDKRRQCIYVSVPKQNLKTLQKLKDKTATLDAKLEMTKSDAERYLVVQREKRLHLVEMYGETGRAKIPPVLEYIGELYNDTDKKFIVFGHHREVLDAIAEHLDEKLQAKYIRIDGDTSQHVRQDLCEQFQEDAGTRVAVLGITAAGVGLTLNAADLVIFAELFWNPAQLLQGEDRAHRIGREGNVDVKYILAQGTLDDVQWPMITRKLAIVGASIDGRKGEMETDLSAVDREKERRAKLQPRIDEVFAGLGGEEQGEVLDELVGGEVESGEGRGRGGEGSSSSDVRTPVRRGKVPLVVIDSDDEGVISASAARKTVKKRKALVVISDEEEGSSSSPIKPSSTSGRSSSRTIIDADADEDDEAFARRLQEEEEAIARRVEGSRSKRRKTAVVVLSDDDDNVPGAQSEGTGGEQGSTRMEVDDDDDDEAFARRLQEEEEEIARRMEEEDERVAREMQDGD
ncbi:SWI/SNF- matrix-associated actin-dependent regulator of chromatin sub A-like protein 1 [Rhizophlyctis rosea]|nr:SWI/SNF- matrix-associated actin-dependent regulator of chromatin sub A-like protein 1 [Rhizophlyctis rosea]